MNVVWQGKKKSRYIIHPKNGFRTARHCWDHTAGDGLWTDRSWRLGWTLPERAFLENKSVCLAYGVGCSTLAKALDKHGGRQLGESKENPWESSPTSQRFACTPLSVDGGGFAWAAKGGTVGLRGRPMWAGHPSPSAWGQRWPPWCLEGAYHHGWCPSGGRSSLSSSLVLTRLLASSLQKKPSYRLPVWYDRSKELVRNTLS